MLLPFLLVFGFMSAFSSNAWALDNTDHILGTNLEGISDYSGDWPFTNRMKSTRKWITFDASKKDTTWDTQIPIPSDENGYPLQVPFDPDGNGGVPPQGVRTILINSNNHYPAGEYTLSFEGKGRLHLEVDAQCPWRRSSDGQCIFKIPYLAHRFLVKKPTGGGLRLTILNSKEGDHIRSIRILPSRVDNADKSIFHPTFLERLQGFKVLRFMNWASVNHSKIKRWSERVHTDHYTYANATLGSGVPYEVMIDLSNELKADAWFTIPTYADDDFVKNLARLIASRLENNKTVYVEYSNEVWNTIFPQNNYITELGTKLGLRLGLSLNKQEANAIFYARRSVEIFEIFERELIGRHKLVKVVSGQGVNPFVARKVISWLDDPRVNPKKIRANALAIALYFGAQTVDNLLTDNGKLDKKAVDAARVKAIKVDAFLDNAAKELREHRKPRMIEHRALARRNDMRLLAYEGGQSMRVGYGYSRAVIQAATEKLIKANRTERMGDLYREMFDIWFGNGGDAFVNFSLIYRPRRWGAWGILEHQWQKPDQAPKFRAVREQLSREK